MSRLQRIYSCIAAYREQALDLDGLLTELQKIEPNMTIANMQHYVTGYFNDGGE